MHYAEDVQYTALGWLEKNRGKLQPDLAALIGGPRANHPSIVMWDVFNEKDCVGVVAPEYPLGAPSTPTDADGDQLCRDWGNRAARRRPGANAHERETVVCIYAVSLLLDVWSVSPSSA